MVASFKLGILHFEIEPLLVALRISVHLAEQVIFLNYYLFSGTLLFNHSVVDWVGFNSLKVSTLDSRVKFEVLGVEQAIVSLEL